jgi:hypothetical protein
MAFIPFEPITACALTLACLAAPVQPVASSLLLSLHETAGRVAVASLSCEPAGGSHPKKEAACETLRSVGGDFGRITSRPQNCTMIYQPVDVTASGTWRGKPVKFAATYASRCSADAGSRGIFDF